MWSKAHDAFRATDTPDDKARKAAEEIAGFEDRLTPVESDPKLAKWMVGFHLALSMVTVALLLRLVAYGNMPRKAVLAQGRTK